MNIYFLNYSGNFVSIFLSSEYAKKQSKLLKYIADFDRQLEYLYKLINIINVQNLTQVSLF